MTKARLTIAHVAVPLGLASSTAPLLLSNTEDPKMIAARAIFPVATASNLPDANVSTAIAENWVVPILDVARFHALGHRRRMFLGCTADKRGFLELLSGRCEDRVRSRMTIPQTTVFAASASKARAPA